MSAMVSMELDDEDANDAPMPIPMADKPKYPYGLCISLTTPELEKLGIDVTEAEVGGVFMIQGLARITNLSMSDGENGTCCRLEAQIENLGVLGGDEPAPDKSKRTSLLYKST